MRWLDAHISKCRFGKLGKKNVVVEITGSHAVEYHIPVTVREKKALESKVLFLYI